LNHDQKEIDQPMTNTNQLAVRQPTSPTSSFNNQSVIPSSVQRPSTSLDDLMQMAKVVASSGLIQGLQTPSAVFTLMLICESEGLHPAQALKRYHVIEGRPTMRADAMQADFMRLGGLVRWERSDAEVCTARFVHAKYAPDPGFQVTVTLAELVESGVATTWNKEKRQTELKANYKRHPRQMLRARAISEGVRAVYPGVVAGIYTPEELDDYRDAPMVTVQTMPSTAAEGNGSNDNGGGGGNLEGSVILQAQPDPGFAAKVQQAGTLSGVARPPGDEGGPVDYSVAADPLTNEQLGRLRVLVQDILKLSREAKQAILLEFGVARPGDLSAVDAETIIRRLEAQADNDDPFGAGAADCGDQPGQNGGEPPQAGDSRSGRETGRETGTSQVGTAVAHGAAVAPGTPRDDDPRVPLINEVLAVIGRLDWDTEQLTRYLSGLDKKIVDHAEDIMDLNEQQLVYIRDDLKMMAELGYGNGELPGQPAEDLIVPDATRPLTKANARAQARAAKANQQADLLSKDVPAVTPAPASQS
jgi:hypothetical protein